MSGLSRFALVACSLVSSAIPQDDSPSPPTLNWAAELNEFSKFSDRPQPAEVQASDCIRKLMIMHSESAPVLRRGLLDTQKWKTRLGSAFALAQMGYQSHLLKLTNDESEWVRNYSRGVVNRDMVNPAIYGASSMSIDDHLKEWVLEMLEVKIQLSPNEARLRIDSAIKDLMGEIPTPEALNTYKEYGPAEAAFKALAACEPVEVFGGIARSISAASLPHAICNSLRLLTRITHQEDSIEGALWTSIAPVIAWALRHSDTGVRASAAELAALLAPRDQASLVVRHAIRDAEGAVRWVGLLSGLNLSWQYESRGQVTRADELIRDLADMVAAEPPSGFRESAETAMREAVERLKHERALLSGKNGRWLRVGKELIAVSEQEYLKAIEQFGKPYLDRNSFEQIRRAWILKRTSGAEQMSATPGWKEENLPQTFHSEQGTQPNQSASLRLPRGDAPTPEAESSNGRFPNVLLGISVAAFLAAVLYARRSRLS